MRRMGRGLPVLIAFVLAGWLTHPAADSSAVGSVLERFLMRADEPVTQFRATRHLEAQNDRFNKEATMDVVTELLPDGHFTYSILNETGSEMIRRRVMRGMLETEEALAKDPSRFAVTPANYTLVAGEVTDDGTVKLLAKPR